MSKENLDCKKTVNNNKNCNCICLLNLIATILFISISTFICYISPPEEQPFLSSYMEALGDLQPVAQGAYIVFNPDSADSVGNNIVLDSSGTIFTINEPGLYLIEWDVNLAAGSTPAVIGIVENGEGASGAASGAAGNFSSGTLIQVDTVPYTISLYNYGDEITLENHVGFENSAASIRILKFADGPSE